MIVKRENRFSIQMVFDGQRKQYSQPKKDMKVSNLYFFLCSIFSVILGPSWGVTVTRGVVQQIGAVPPWREGVGFFVSRLDGFSENQ